MIRSGARASALLVTAMLAVFVRPSLLHAHGRPPYVEHIALDPGDAHRLVAQASFGLVVSEDGGGSWRWICSAVFRADPTSEDPDVLVTEDGGLVVGAFDGAARSSADLCDWTFPGGPARDVFVVDLEPDPFGSALWGVASDGAADDVIIRSEDLGRSWQAVGSPIEDVLVESIGRAPSDPRRVYLGGAIPAGPGPRRGFVFRSVDEGETYVPMDVALEDGERFPLIAAVDPTNADRLFVRVSRRATDSRQDRLLFSDDGAETFREILRLRDMRGIAISEDGLSVWVGSAEGDGLHVARDGSLDFELVNTLDVRCIETREGVLWLCTDPYRSGFALGRSIDDGTTVEPLLRIQDVEQLPACPECSATGFVCPGWQDDLEFDQNQYFGSGMPPPGGATGQPRDAGDLSLCGAEPPPSEGGCGCRATREDRVPSALVLALFAAVLARTRRSHLGGPA